jgi:hypothetical protein
LNLTSLRKAEWDMAAQSSTAADTELEVFRMMANTNAAATR